MKQNQYAVEILKTAARQTDDIAQAFALDETGKTVVYRYCVKLLNDCLIHGVDIEDEFYIDSMADYLEHSLHFSIRLMPTTLLPLAFRFTLMRQLLKTAKKIARNTRAERFLI